MEKEIPEKVLVEYQKAQDSAEHYNTMIWTLVSIGFGLSLYILSQMFFINYDPFLKLILAVFGISVLVYFSNIIESSNQKKQWKYYICKTIEKDYSFYGQNLRIDELTSSRERIFSFFSGLAILRIFKLSLFLYYLILVVALFLSLLVDPKNYSYFFIILISILTLIEIVVFMIKEVSYWMIKNNFNNILNKKS